MPLQNDFTRLRTKEHLLVALGIDEAAFSKVLSFNPSTEYSLVDSEAGTTALNITPFLRHDIPKKNRQRGFRTVWEPTFVKNIYKGLARRLNEFLGHKLDGFPHPQTFGYIEGRNIRENALGHCGHRLLVSIDIQDFFPSINVIRIRKFLEATGINATVADLLSRFVTIGGTLAPGLATSPTLANAICLPLDIELAALAKPYVTTFSRYADDITFSGNGDLPPLNSIKETILRHGFKIAEPKTRLSKLGQAHYVTGLSVTDPAQPHVPKRKKRRLRQELYYAAKFGIDEHFDRLGINDTHIVQGEINRLDGQVKYTAFHEPRLAFQLKTMWAKVLQDSGHSPSFEPRNQSQIPFYIFIDEAEYTHSDGKTVLALAMSVSQHQDRVHQGVKEVLEDALGNMQATGNYAALCKSGLHFAESHPDLRLKVIERMRSLPFEGYIALATLPSVTEYESTYIRLLNAMIKRRLMAAESKFAYLGFEYNGKVRQQLVRDTVNAAQNFLTANNNRHPKACSVEFRKKPDLDISVPDFLLGVLGNFLHSYPDINESRPSRDRKLFEIIRDKYRLILDTDSGKKFSRRSKIESWGISK